MSSPQTPSRIARSVCDGVVWPAFTDDIAARLLALQYQLEQSQWWPAERIEALQLAQFQLVFDHARATVPFWRGRFAAAPARIDSMAALRTLPVTTRRDIQQAGDAMHSTASPQAHGEVVSTRSSGSTGEPLQTLGTGWTQLLWQVLLLRDHLWHGRDLGGKLAAIRNRGEAAHLPAWGPATSPFVTGPSAVRAAFTGFGALHQVAQHRGRIRSESAGCGEQQHQRASPARGREFQNGSHGRGARRGGTARCR